LFTVTVSGQLLQNLFTVTVSDQLLQNLFTVTVSGQLLQNCVHSDTVSHAVSGLSSCSLTSLCMWMQVSVPPPCKVSLMTHAHL